MAALPVLDPALGQAIETDLSIHLQLPGGGGGGGAAPVTILSKYTADVGSTNVLKRWIGLEDPGRATRFLASLEPDFLAHLDKYAGGTQIGGILLTRALYGNLTQAQKDVALRAKPYRVLTLGFKGQNDPKTGVDEYVSKVMTVDPAAELDAVVYVKIRVISPEIRSALSTQALQDCRRMHINNQPQDNRMNFFCDMYLHRPSNGMILGLHTDSGLTPGEAVPPAIPLNFERLAFVSLLMLHEDEQRLLKSTTFMSADIAAQTLKHSLTLVVRSGIKVAFNDSAVYHSTPVAHVGRPGEVISEARPFHTMQQTNNTQVDSRIGRASSVFLTEPERVQLDNTGNRSFFRFHCAPLLAYRYDIDQTSPDLCTYQDVQGSFPRERSVIANFAALEGEIDRLSTTLDSAIGGTRKYSKNYSKKYARKSRKQKSLKGGGGQPDNFSINIDKCDYYDLMQNFIVIENWIYE
jgi:hypothetical protein